MSVHTSIATDTRTGATAALSDGTIGALSDSKDLRRRAVGFIVHAAGTVRVTTEEQDDGVYTDWPAPAVGILYPVTIRRLWSTGTSVAAANITLLYSKF
jgi:hypothetical protein